MNQAVVIDLSSDDELGLDEHFTVDNFDWISNFLEDVPSGDGVVNFASNVGDDDSDDVVVVGEVLPKSKRAKISVPAYRNEGFDVDDDCVVLSCDPDKPTDGHDKGTYGDSDDLCIVGEKGQVACRDYPHSRHLCAKFPFGSTPHESRCNLCHCYVCDALAPCAYWGSGVSGLDHCSATDKVEYWQLERKKIRQLKNPPPPKVKLGSEPVFKLPQLQETSARPTLVPRIASSYGVSSSFRLQNIISHNRSQRPNITIPRNKVQSHLVSGQLLRPCHGPTRSHKNSSSAPCMASSRSLSKRSGFTGRIGLVSRSAYIPPNVSGSYWQQQLLNCSSVGKPAESNSINVTESSAHLNVNISSSQPLVSCLLTGTLPSHLQGYNVPVAPTPTSNLQGYVKSTVVTSDSPWMYSSGRQAQIDSTSFIPSNISDALNIVTPSCQQSSGGIQNVSGSNFPCNTSSVLSSVTPRIHQPSEAIQNFTDSGFPYNSLKSMNGIAQSHQQAENPLVQNVVPRPGYLPSVEHNPQISGGMDSRPLNIDINSWFWDNDPPLVVQDGSNLFNMNNQPSVPGPGSVDAGMLYSDFETACRGLAHS